MTQRLPLFPVKLTFVAILSCACVAARAEDSTKRIRDAAKKSTLDQPGTKPFHLKAELAPSRDRDKDSGRTGTVEIWWASPTQYRREVRSPEFHQIEIVNGGRVWQKNEGAYFPEWLWQTSVELIDPIPQIDHVIEQAEGAEVKHMAGSTYYQWSEMSGDGNVQKGMGATVAITDATGLLFYGGGGGWGALFKDYKSFHGREVARSVSVGTPELTARVVTLEDLGDVPAQMFDAAQSGGDAQPIRTMVVDELALRKNLISSDAPQWPPIENGPLEGVFTTSAAVDRSGHVRQVGTIVTENPAMEDAARGIVSHLQFKPYLIDGIPVQVVSRITMPFKSTRPAGAENFPSAKGLFEEGREAGFPAAVGKPYVLKAEFEVGVRGKVMKGSYEDDFANKDQWRREARIADSKLVKSVNGDKRYDSGSGEDVNLLRLVLRLMEPIPALDSFYEADWKIKRDTIGDTSAIRVLAGYVSPEGELDPEQARAYWFDNNGVLLQTFFKGLEARRSDFADVNGAKVAKQILVYSKGKLAMRIVVTETSTPEKITGIDFVIPGHGAKRAFSDEAR